MNKAIKISLIILTLILFVGLVMYSVIGFTTRYAQDDYCYGYRLNENGFLRNQWLSYTQNTEYNGNRYSLTFLINIVELIGGPDVVFAVPMLFITLWTLALSLLIKYILNYVNNQSHVLLSICASVFVTFFAIYLSPQQYQVFFWLSGSLTYLAPMVIYTIILVLFLYLLTVDKIKIVPMIVVGLLTLFAGGFSETSTLWFVMLSGFINIYLWFFKRIDIRSNRVRILSLIIFTASLLSTLLLALSPYNAVSSRTDMSSIYYALRYSFIYAVDFIVYTLKSAPVPYFILIVFGYLIAHIVKPVRKIKNTKILMILFMISIVFYILCASSMFPTVYAMSAYPGPRALTSAHVSLLVYLIFLGWLLERIQRNILPILTKRDKVENIVLIIIIVSFSAYVGRAIFLESQEIPDHQNRARAWDARHEAILNAQIAGMQHVEIPAFDSIFMITEMTENPGHWVNQCAAQYYNVSSIEAIENYDHIGTYPLGK